MAVAELAIRAAHMEIAALQILGKFATSGIASETVHGLRKNEQTEHLQSKHYMEWQLSLK